MTMVTAMGIEKHAEYYRGYQPDDRSIWPVAIVLATMVALWLLVYLIAAVGPQPEQPTAAKSPSPPTPSPGRSAARKTIGTRARRWQASRCWRAGDDLPIA